MAITYTISNLSSTTDISLRSIEVSNDINVQHHADLSNLGGYYAGVTDFTGTSTIVSETKTYSIGGYLKKQFVLDSEDVIRTISYSSSTLLIINSAAPSLQPGWIANSSGNSSLDGLYIVSISPSTSTWLTMSGPPSSPPTIGGTVTFSTTTDILVLADTDNLDTGWTITENGYTPHLDPNDDAKITSVYGDGVTVEVDLLPTNPLPDEFMYFRAPTDFLTLVESTSDLEVGWLAIGNGYDGTQSITNILGDNHTVIMSGKPSSVPTGGLIKFYSDADIYTINTSSSVTFTMNYTSPTNTIGDLYASLVFVNARQGGIDITRLINNFVTISHTAKGPSGIPTFSPADPTSPGYEHVITEGGWVITNVSTYGEADPNNPDALGATISITGWTNTLTGENKTTISVNGLIGGITPDPNNPNPPTPNPTTGEGDSNDGGDSVGTVSGGTSTGTGTGGGQPGAGGAGDPCFLPDAQILMSDGTYKNFIDLKVGDLVIGAFGEINPVLGLYNHILTTPMYTINGEHNSTADEVFVSPNREFYCMDVEATEAYWTMPQEITVADGSIETWVCVGLLERKIQHAELGIEIKTPDGSKTLNTIEILDLPEGTRVYNCVIGGSNTYFVNGYAHTAWLREDAFDYDLWEPTGLVLTVEDYRNPKMHQLKVSI